MFGAFIDLIKRTLQLRAICRFLRKLPFFWCKRLADCMHSSMGVAPSFQSVFLQYLCVSLFHHFWKYCELFRVFNYFLMYIDNLLHSCLCEQAGTLLNSTLFKYPGVFSNFVANFINAKLSFCQYLMVYCLKITLENKYKLRQIYKFLIFFSLYYVLIF